ncbi:MarR family winged helix-turn-helix transcriptional regulator [Demequina zhanjiangensis]|uniref:MarR family transcriptional regulator n=1 Tax=Demequina zhanjiangensis TaxID=3051659 RepID=A0ABT8G1D2_9MICO|nr:MarR family transcriptional regulator [Demequina sp. SYSU T00b26]MDN4472948.1 MarR family transcriptional regulator [Demequina sp. SYSU T00b26]
MTPDALTDRDAAMVRLERSVADVQAAYRDVLRDVAVRVHPELQSLGFRLLASISRRGPLTAGDAADAIHTDRAVVSRLIKDLEKLGLLEVTPHPEDRRQRVLALTPDAVRRLAPLRGSGRSLLARSLDTWDVADVEAYAAFNERLISAYRAYFTEGEQPAPEVG